MVVLTQDQKEAVRLGCSNEPIVGIQAAFGTGKTLIGAIIAALSSDSPNTTVIVTTSTNAAVAQFTDTLLSLGDFSHLRVVRHISDSAAADNRTPTDADLGKILKTLGDTFYDQLDFDERVICTDFRDHRQLLEDYLAHPERVPEMSDDEKEQYEIAEEYVSATLRRMVRIMFKVYRPSVICMTTASLLNSTANRTGIFTPYIPSFRTIIGDEASQIPEPALLAIAARFQDARHVYIGDEHQLAPHAKCPHASNPVLHGARGVMSIISHAPGVPVAPLVTTFRAHPALIEIPNIIAYSGTLVSGTPAEARTLLVNSRIRFPSPGVPFMFIHMEGTSVQAISKSHYNTVEGTVCLRLLDLLAQNDIPKTSICVITFYREQFRYLREPLSQREIELTTVDSVQGREKDVVIILTTKTNFSPSSAEFLDDYRRLNVATTRCRHGLFIIGHAPSLRVIPTWSRLLDWADSIGAIVPNTRMNRFF
uniref:AAA_12 domain-containing protein n=1 Tax=Haemonchus contortus TaxID=6289 RepID=A0A7I4YL56_HAECO